jgi:hypothetical protein
VVLGPALTGAERGDDDKNFFILMKLDYKHNKTQKKAENGQQLKTIVGIGQKQRCQCTSS